MRNGRRIGAVLLLLLGTLVPALAVGAEAKDYAYLFFQGRVMGPGRRDPLSGARVRLTSGDRVFEAATDARGLFEFPKLPLGTFDLEVRTADGTGIVRARRRATPGADVTRLELVVGKRANPAPSGIVIRATRTGVEVDVPRPPTNWGRLGGQALAFVGSALLLLAL